MQCGIKEGKSVKDTQEEQKRTKRTKKGNNTISRNSENNRNTSSTIVTGGISSGAVMGTGELYKLTIAYVLNDQNLVYFVKLYE